jgi:hypothetical protein
MVPGEAGEALLDTPRRGRRGAPPRAGFTSFLAICFATLSFGLALQALNGTDCKSACFVLFGPPVMLVLQVVLLPTLVTRAKERHGNGRAFVWVSVAGIVAAVAAMVVVHAEWGGLSLV